MKNRNRIALILTLCLCMGVFAACANNTKAPEQSAAINEDRTSETSAERSYTVAEVTAVNENGTFRSSPCTAEQEADFSDYLMADLSGYTATGAVEELTLADTTKVILAKDGALTDAAVTDIVVGDVIVVEKIGNTVEQAVVYSGQAKKR